MKPSHIKTVENYENSLIIILIKNVRGREDKYLRNYLIFFWLPQLTFRKFMAGQPIFISLSFPRGNDLIVQDHSFIYLFVCDTTDSFSCELMNI